ncbi:MAG: hypothetical protein R8G66_03130 [Cytophagales bacterium]|nr:hypothetical protein [Cytophagales bacterium]
MLQSFSTNISQTSTPRRLLGLILISLVFCISSHAQFQDKHNYVLGGSLVASNNLGFLDVRFGKTIKQGNVLGVSVNASQDAITGISGWYRLTRELKTISFPIFYKMDIEAGYFDEDAIAVSVNPGLTIPVTKSAYLDLSFALLRLQYRDELESFVSVNRIGLGLVLGI